MSEREPTPAPAGPSAEPPAAITPPSPSQRKLFWLKVALLVGLLGLLVFGIASIELEPDLGHLDVTLLTGSERGHYRAIGERLAEVAKERRGTLRVTSTQGTIENVQRLVTHAKSPTVQFALAQDGLAWSDEQRQTLRLIARLPSRETVFFITHAERAPQLRRLRDLKGKRIGIGPAGSGTAQLAGQVYAGAGLEALQPELVRLPLDQQLAQLQTQQLDLGVFVMYEDAPLVRDALRGSDLVMVSFPELPALAGREPFLRLGEIPLGHYDPVEGKPAQATPVLQVDTLVLGDGSASHSETVALLRLLDETYPGFVRHNLDKLRASGLKPAPAAETFFENGGPDLLQEYFPALANLIPLSNLVHLVMAISILFNLMGAGHRFALWRIDAGRVALEERWNELFGPLTAVGLSRTDPGVFAGRGPELEALIADFELLEQRCRKLSVSMLVPMGQELTYRYQESLIQERLAALRPFAATAKQGAAA